MAAKPSGLLPQRRHDNHIGGAQLLVHPLPLELARECHATGEPQTLSQSFETASFGTITDERELKITSIFGQTLRSSQQYRHALFRNHLPRYAKRSFCEGCL